MRCLICTLTGLSILTMPASAGEGEWSATIARLAEPTPSGLSSLVRLREAMYQSDLKTIGTLQTQLCQELETCRQPEKIQALCLVLAAAPCEQAVQILSGKLATTVSDDARIAATNGLRLVVPRMPHLPANQAATALATLEASARRGDAPLELMDATVLAIAAFGPVGVDLLLELRADARAGSSFFNVFYTALSESRDPRVLPVLRAACEAESTHDGLRIQALHGIGQFFLGAALSGAAVDPAEAAACAGLFKSYLSESVPDQVYAAALRGLGRTSGFQRDEGLRQAVVEALRSSSSYRREAALDVLYQSDTLLDAQVDVLVRDLARSEGDDSTRSTAEAILDHQEALADVGNP